MTDIPQPPGHEPIVIVPYDVTWPILFHRDAERVRAALDTIAIRIDHIGSTAVPGLAAKPVIDMQISVATLDDLQAFRAPLEELGYRFRADNPDQTKRYFRESPGGRRTHIHVRRHGSWGEQFALLFRDYMRVHPERAKQYADLKIQIADRHRFDRLSYVKAKGPFIWEVIAEADKWAQITGWSPGPSDA